MKKIVDLRELRDYCKVNIHIGGSSIYDYHLSACVNAIFYWLKQQPDAEEKHGKWIKYGYKWKCSCCDMKINIDGTPLDNNLYYCPNCGAKMELGEEEKPTKKPSYKQLFYDAFPQARKHVQSGTPPFEACHVWPDADFDCEDDCDKCWKQESE